MKPLWDYDCRPRTEAAEDYFWLAYNVVLFIAMTLIGIAVMGGDSIMDYIFG